MLAAASSASAQADERVIYTSVVDRDGAPVLDLTMKDFIVREDGQAREVLRVARDNDPLQIALLVDNSASMRPRLSLLRKAVTAFIDATREDVQLALITLAERPTIVVGYTTDRAALRKAADNMFAYEAANYLLDGIAETSQGLAKRTMWRSAIAVITGVGPEMSYRQYTEVLRFFRAGGASLHVVQVGCGHRRTGARDRRQQGHVRNRGTLRRSAAADRPRAEVAAARDGTVESVSRDVREAEPARAAVKDRSQRAAPGPARARNVAEDRQVGSEVGTVEALGT